jgi:predicted Na+-dependent transporter
VNTVLDLLALGSAWLVMFGLALNAPAALTRPSGWIAATLLGYLLPGLGLLALAGLGLSPPHLLGLALCIAAGFGTSGAALHRLAGGDARQAAHLVIGSSLLALPLMLLLVAVAAEPTAQVALLGKVFLVGLLGQILPYALGRGLLSWRPDLGRRLAAPLERLAGVAVIGLIALIAQQTLPRLVAHAELLVAASLLVSLLLAASLGRQRVQDGNPQLLLLVRNLGGAILLARVLPAPGEVLLAITAFGVPMYAAALLGLLGYRHGLRQPIEN